MVQLDSLKILSILADATNIIAEGEVLQLMNCNDLIPRSRYFNVIYGKTAKLFEAATQLAGILTEQDDDVTASMADYGRYLGTAFQLVDDLLDYTADTATMGKNAGDDLAEGKPTLPLLYAMWHGDETEQNLIRAAIENGDGREHLQTVLTAMERTGALTYTREKALEAAQQARDALADIPDSDYKQALLALADLSVNRINAPQRSKGLPTTDWRPLCATPATLRLARALPACLALQAVLSLAQRSLRELARRREAHCEKAVPCAYGAGLSRRRRDSPGFASAFGAPGKRAEPAPGKTRA